MTERDAAAIGGPWQLGFVVPELKPALQTWWADYGVGPWSIWNLTVDRLADHRVRGRLQPFGMRIAIAQWDPVEIELIEPLDGESIYAESLTMHGDRPHLHHVHCSTDSFDEVLARFGGRGLPPAMSGGMNGSRFFYTPTEGDIGIALEFGVAPPGWTFPEPDAVYPPP